MSQLETHYPGESVGAIADKEWGMIFLDFVLARIERGDPDDLTHASEITKVLSSGGQELEQQYRRLPFIQDEVSPEPSIKSEIPSWLWLMLNPVD